MKNAYHDDIIILNVIDIISLIKMINNISIKGLELISVVIYNETSKDRKKVMSIYK